MRLLRERGERGAEGYVVWVGELDTIGIVHEVWPVSAEANGAHASVSFDDVLALGERVHARGWYILSQIHSHPFGAFHSSIDDQHPVSHQIGFVSIVVPNFAADLPLQGWSVNEHIGSGRWRELDRDEVARRLAIHEPGEEIWWKRLWAGITARHSSSGH
jgi:hypothetical protein